VTVDDDASYTFTVTIPADGRTVDDVTAALAAAVAPLGPSVDYLDPSMFATMRDFTGRTPDDYQQFDQSTGPVIGATMIVDARAGDVVEIDLNSAQVHHHGWYLPTEVEDPSGERFDDTAAILEARGASVENRAPAPGVDPDTVIVLPNGDTARLGDWVVDNRRTGTLEVRSTDLRPLPPQRVLDDNLRAWLVDAYATEVKPVDDTATILTGFLAFLQREGVARPFSTEALLLGTGGIIQEGSTIDFSVSPPHWYTSLMARIFGDMLAESDAAINYVEQTYRASWTRPDGTEEPREYKVIICRPNRPSPHQLRREAEAAVQALVATGDMLASCVGESDELDQWNALAAEHRPPSTTPPDFGAGPRRSGYEWARTAGAALNVEGWATEFTIGRTTFHPASPHAPVTEAEYQARTTFEAAWSTLPAWLKAARFTTEAVAVLSNSLAPLGVDALIRNVRTRGGSRFDGWVDDDSADAAKWIADGPFEFDDGERPGWRLSPGVGSGHGGRGPRPDAAPSSP